MSTAADHAQESAGERKKKAKMVNVSEELGNLYEVQRVRLDSLFKKEVEKKIHLKETTDNVAVTMKMLELIHSIQSEKNIEDAIEAKDNRIDTIIKGFEEDSEEENPEDEEA